MRPLAVTLGDPAGIGPEVVLKAVADLGGKIPLWLFGDWSAARQTIFSSKMPRLERVSQTPTTSQSHGVVFVDVGAGDDRPLEFGAVDARYGRIALRSIDAALGAVVSGACSALVTAPIHKRAIEAAGSPFPGHTELLAQRSGLRRYGFDYAMYFDSPSLKVVLLSVHVSLAEAIRAIDASLVEAIARLTDREYHRLYGGRPRIAAAGLNPHAGEGGKFGGEEATIAEGVRRAREAGVDVSGPYSPDTIYLQAVRGTFDVVIAAYHDQGLIPVKTLEFERSVNVTLGLPYLRCSVDHGTAFDIAGKDRADAAPMRYAIEWAARHAEEFRR